MELRKDYLLDRWVIISSKRSDRPSQFVSEDAKSDAVDFFAPGNEHLTPPEIGRVSDGSSWKIRWFPNKFPFLIAEGAAEVQTHNEFYSFASAFGHHDIIVESPGREQLWDVSREHLGQLLRVYQERIHTLSSLEHIKYVLIFKNHGREAGTSLRHSHSQIASLGIIPPEVVRKCVACKGDDPYRRIIGKEKGSERRCFENRHFIAFCPYASRFSYEILILAKAPIYHMDDFTDHDFSDLADVMKRVLDKLKELNAPFNYFIHYSPKGDSMRFQIEMLPRFSTFAGFEFGSGMIVNSVSPETAAKFYRGE